MELLFSSSVRQLEDLYSLPVTFTGGSRGQISLNAIYQDNNVQNPLATVVALHGSPGSHNDFKYMLPLLTKLNIRFIGVNYPGHGYTAAHCHLLSDNFERHGYVNALLDALNLDEKLIFLGHSRGAENALMLAAERKAYGLVMINPHGLRLNRGLKPFWLVRTYATVYNLAIPGWKTLMDPLYYKLYQYVKLNAPSGSIAGTSITTMSNVFLEKQLPYIKTVNKEKVESDTEKDVQKLEVALRKKGCSFYFPTEGHFLQKSRAEFIVNGIKAMLQS